MTADLVGLQAVKSDGTVLGTVKDVMPAPAHDILIVNDIMIPADKQFVKKVDIKNVRIVVELIDGMLPEDE
jgi:16S rRNA processing protein RimM